MGIAAVVTALNGVSEALRPLYKQDGDKFILDVEPVNGFKLEDVSGLLNALNGERALNAGHTAKLKTFEGIDPATARQAVARLAEFGDLDPNKARKGIEDADRFSKFNPETEAERIAERKLENAKTQLNATHLNEKTELTNQLTALTEKLSARDRQLEKSLKDGVIVSALAKARPIEAARDLLAQMAANAIQLKEVDGEFRPVVVDASGNPRTKNAADWSAIPFTVEDLMVEMRNQRSALFQPDEKKGLGTEGSRHGGGATVGLDGPNPFAKATLNMTQQMIVMRKDPALAARLKAEAGA